MINILILILSLFIISLSIIGYGIGFQKVFIKKELMNIILDIWDFLEYFF